MSNGGAEEQACALWLAKLDQAGGRVWTRNDSDATSNQGKGIATDLHGNVFTVGLTASGTGRALCKYSEDGELLWSDVDGYPQHVATDAEGNAIVVGTVEDDSHSDIWLRKYDANGD